MSRHQQRRRLHIAGILQDLLGYTAWQSVKAAQPLAAHRGLYLQLVDASQLRDRDEARAAVRRILTRTGVQQLLLVQNRSGAEPSENSPELMGGMQPPCPWPCDPMPGVCVGRRASGSA